MTFRAIVFRSAMGASFPAATVPAGMESIQSLGPVLRTEHLVILEDDIVVSTDFFKCVMQLKYTANTSDE